MTCFASLDESTLNRLHSTEGISVIFKHSTRCSISSTALNRLQSFCSKTDKPVNSFIVNVIENRSISNELANRLLVEHQSPQLLVLKDGKLVMHRSHLGIVEKELLSVINEL